MLSQVLLLGSMAGAVAHASKDLMPTPPMGFNNWSRFQCELNETLFTETADAMVSKGLLKAGYDRVNVDDCWPLHERAEDGSLQWDPEKFPNGMPWLGKYLKERGLKFGIYSDAGNLTCGEYPGSLGYEAIDAKTFADWGVDYLKLDGCFVNPSEGSLEKGYKDIYGNWSNILNEMDNPLIFSESAPAYFSEDEDLSDWYKVMDWVPGYGELARHSADVANYGTEGVWESILYNYDFHMLVSRYQVPGYFNDPDFLVSDDPGLTIDEKKSQFALWTSTSAPLIISAHIPSLTDEEVEYLTNKELIAVDQDELALHATLVSRDGTWDVLSKNLANGDRLLTVLNRGDKAGSTSVSLGRAGLSSDKSCEYTLRDLWTGKESKASGKIDISNLASHATVVYRIATSDEKCGKATPTGMIFNTKSKKCLTADGEKATWTKCSAADSQVWRAEGSQIKTLNDDESKQVCLAAGGDGKVSTAACKENEDSQGWTFKTTGNIVNAASESCLTEGGDGSASASECKSSVNSQVFGAPSGIEFQ